LSGYAGQILRVDLSKKKIVKEPLNDRFARKYLGARGINAKILYDEIKPGVDSLSKDNILLFGAGPLCGTVAPSASRTTATAKSPLSNGIGDSHAGGHFGPELKYAGYDNIVFYGRAEKPSFLWICDENVELLDAQNLWGKTTWQTDKMIKDDLGDEEIQVAATGQAGENLVRFACIVTDLARAFGRCGIGAVMGSKNLKAIAIRGTKGIDVADMKTHLEAVNEALQSLYSNPNYEFQAKFGTMALQSISAELGWLPIKNFTEGEFKGITKIDGETFLQDFYIKNKACFGCALHCGHYFAVKRSQFAGTEGEGTEFVNVEALGTKVGNENFPSILKAHNLCNQYGLDTEETGDVIAFAMECYEKGVINEKDTGGQCLDWGNYEAELALIERIAMRQGLGRVLGEGVQRASKIIGKGAEKYALAVKGSGLGPYEPRAIQSFALQYAVNTKGPSHLRAFLPCTNMPPVLGEPVHIIPIIEDRLCTSEEIHRLVQNELRKNIGLEFILDMRSPEGKSVLYAWYEILGALADSVGICQFPIVSVPWGIRPIHIRKMLNSATGWHFEWTELLRIAERIVNVERAFNIREGFSSADDSLPDRFLREPLPNGPAKGLVVKLDQMKREYYALRGWDDVTGLLTRAKLEELQLGEIADELERLGKLAEAEAKTRGIVE